MVKNLFQDFLLLFVGKVIFIGSTKGGVGKTTCAANISYLFSSLGYDTLVVDTNLTGANLAMQFGIDLKNSYTIHHVLRGKVDPLEAIYLHRNSGLKIMPGSIDLDLIWKAKANYIPRVIRKVRDLFDFIILDTPPGVNENVLKALEASDEAIIVTTQDLASLGETLKILELSESLGKEVSGVIINKYSGRFEFLRDQIEKFLGKEILGTVREDVNVLKAQGSLSPVVEAFPKCKASKDFERIALKYLNLEKRESVLEKFFNLFYK